MNFGFYRSKALKNAGTKQAVFYALWMLHVEITPAVNRPPLHSMHALFMPLSINSI